MFEISKDTEHFNSCQACHSETDLYNITISDGRFGTELHLCKKCCITLKNILAAVHLDDVKMMSFDELNVDKIK